MTKRIQKKRVWLYLYMCILFIASFFVTDRKVYAIDDPLTIKFVDSNGNVYNSQSPRVLRKGESVKLPAFSEMSGVSGQRVWKMKNVSPEDTMTFGGGETVSYDAFADWPEYIQNNEVTLYASKVCTLTFYNNTGSKCFTSNTIKAYEGTKVRLPGSLDGNSLNKGWSRYKNGTGVWKTLNSNYTVTDSLKLYLVYYVKITFKDYDGTSGSAYTKLTKTIKRGSTLTMPSVPSKSKYSSLGWATTKKTATVKYKASVRVVITKNITFYAARKYVPYTVSFYTNAGKSTTATQKLAQKVQKNEVVTLPKAPAVTGYVSLGWTKTVGGKTVTYKEGAKVKITGNTKLYAIYRKAKSYKVSFYLGNGSTNSAYQKLTKTLYENQKISLPQVPERTGYVNQGWYLTVNGKKTLYQPGQKVTVNNNLKFYANQKQKLSITYHKNNGSTYETVYCLKGESITLPSKPNTTEATFMGWSLNSNQKVPGIASYYEAGGKLVINSSIHLYEVLSIRAKEDNLLAYQMAKLNTAKYKKAVWVGDSRTVRMEKTILNKNGESCLKNISFVAKSGEGLEWLKGDGHTKILNAVGSGSASGELPTAVIINLGVNDLSDYEEYISYLNALGLELRSKGCKMFLLSVNPINSSQIDKFAKQYYPLKIRKEVEVRLFNKSLKNGLKGYTYIDSYYWLIKNGYSTDNGEEGHNTGMDDGLHYTEKTYKRIFDYCLKKVNAS